MVVVEMVDTLTVFERHEVYVLYFSGPLEVVVRWPYVLVLGPSSFQQRSTQLKIAAFDNKNLLIVPNTISSFPRAKVNTGIFLFLLFFLNRIFFIVISFIFFIFFAGRMATVCYCVSYFIL